MRYFEYSPDDKQIYYLNRMDTTDPQRGFCFMPKLGLNVYGCEIARLYKLHNKNWCEVIPFIVPRRSGLFQDDLYPDTVAAASSLDANEWLAGRDADPIKVNDWTGSRLSRSLDFVTANLTFITTASSLIFRALSHISASPSVLLKLKFHFWSFSFTSLYLGLLVLVSSLIFLASLTPTVQPQRS